MKAVTQRLLRSQLFRNTFWASSGNGLMALVSFGTAIFVVRNIGPSEYGILQEMTAYFLIAQNFENLVNPNLFKKSLLEHPSASDTLIRSLGALISLTGLLFFLLSSLAVVAFDLPTQYWLLSIMLTGMLFRFTNGISFFFDAHLQTIKSQISLNVGNLFSCGFKLAASFWSPTALLQAVSVPIQYVITAGIHVLQYRNTPNLIRGRIEFTKMMHLALVGFPVFLSSFVDLLKGRIPFLFLGMETTPENIGLFGAGIRLSEPWLFVASALGMSFWPKLVQTKAENPAAYKRAMNFFFLALLCVFTPLALGGYFLSHTLVLTVLGEQYAGSLGVFQIQSLTLLFQAIGLGIVLVEINEGAIRISLIRNLISLGLTIAGLYLLYPLRGIDGAALAVLIANGVSCLIIPALFSQTRIITRALLSAPVYGLGVVLRAFRQ